MNKPPPGALVAEEVKKLSPSTMLHIALKDFDDEKAYRVRSAKAYEYSYRHPIYFFTNWWLAWAWARRCDEMGMTAQQSAMEAEWWPKARIKEHAK